MTLRPCKAAADCVGHYLAMFLLAIQFKLSFEMMHLYEIHQTIALIVAGEIADPDAQQGVIDYNRASEARFFDWRDNDGTEKGFVELLKVGSDLFDEWQTTHIPA